MTYFSLSEVIDTTQNQWDSKLYSTGRCDSSKNTFYCGHGFVVTKRKQLLVDKLYKKKKCVVVENSLT